MEPEIIRMYSSSPPPLDSVADDDEEDEFGEFGGFSGVSNSGMGFGDFDSINYSKSEEEFIPSNHFMPIHDYSNNVNNFTSLTSLKEENTSEVSSKKGPYRTSEINTSDPTAVFNVAAFNNKGSSQERTKTSDIFVDSESEFTCVNSTEFTSRGQNLPVGTCNGEKVHSMENLTNGFAMVLSVSPQVIEDQNSGSESKGLKNRSTHSTDLMKDFIPTSNEHFADFDTFSNTGTVYLENAEHNNLNEGQTNIKCNSSLSRFESDVHCIKEVLKDQVGETNDLALTNCTSETDLIIPDNAAPHKEVTASTETNLSDDAAVCSVDNERTIRELTDCKINKEEMLQTIDCIGYSKNNNSLGTMAGTEILKANSTQENFTNMAGLVNVLSGNKNVYLGQENGSFEDSRAANTDQSLSSKDHLEFNSFLFKETLDANVNDLNDDFGDFEDTNFASFQEEIKQTTGETLTSLSSCDRCPQLGPSEESEEFEFGDFGSMAKVESSDFPDSDDFADFSSAGNINHPSDWNAFEDDQVTGSTWAAFVDEKTDSSPPASEAWQCFRTDVPASIDNQDIITENIILPAIHESASSLVSEESTSGCQQSLLCRLERIIQACFPPSPVVEVENNISPLDYLLKTEKLEETVKSLSAAREVLDIWTELQDIHDAYGLKYQWGGSHSNKKLLCSLGIDTRNILFTGNKKQPVIVPMYAASLGMLEPMKEPLKPLSAAEKIASIGQASSVPAEESICTSDQLQESLPPVQFDWSSSGLTNPLDGVDPELYELTTSKLEYVSTSSKVADVFARLMSTAETTSTSARRPKRDENLSEEAAKVIASLPDLSFMHAKVLMFPSTLTPSKSSQG
ncbi:aftiphilin isoform 2-T2 [Rhinophrynus dorsalis]